MKFSVKKVSFLALAMLGSTTAQALEEIVVTATKRSTSIQDVPFSINAQTQEDLRRAGADNLEDVSRAVAGLTIQNLGPGQSQVAIRGVSAGQIVRDQPGVKEQVGVYMDESVISLSLFTPDFDLFDLNRVETLRGPQGTLFGSGSVGGTIRYITNQPELDTSEGSIELNLNQVTDGGVGGHAKGMINVPISDAAALRLVAYHTEYGGFVDALGEGGRRIEDVNSGGRTGVRAAITFQPSDSLSITPRVIYQDTQTDGFNRQEVFNLYANPFTTTRPAISLQEREQYLLRDGEEFEDQTLLADLTVEASFDGFDLTSISSYTDRDILVSRDASALTHSVSIDLAITGGGILLVPSNLRDTTVLEQFTQEIRISSNSDSRLQWLFGGFYSDTQRDYAQRLPTPGYAAATDAVFGAGTSAAVANGFANLDSPFNSDLAYDLEQIAIFGEITYALSDQTEISIGGRYYDYEEVRTISSGGLFAAGDSNTRDETTADGFSPRITLSHDLSDELTMNAQVSRGFRLGGVNDPLNVALCNAADRSVFGGFQDYDDEELTNYEIGIKGNYETISFNAAAFYSDIENLQVTLDAGSCSSRISFNVEDSHSAGLEFEMRAEPNENWFFSAAASYVESEFDSTVFDSTGAVIGGVQEGNRLASVPEFQAALTASYTQPSSLFGSDGDLYASASFQHVGSRFTQPGDQVAGSGTFVSGLPFGGATGTQATVLDLELPSYEVVNVNLGFATGDWDAKFYVNNLFDENALLSFDRERGGRARLAFRTNQPRTFGVTFRRDFDL